MTNEEAKDWLKAIDGKYIHGGDEGFDAKRKEAISMAIKALDQEPSRSGNPNKWIPVSERYTADPNKCYLVCYEDGCITIEYLYFNDDGDPFFSEMELGVVAWMPLPEPYKESPTGSESEEV